LAATRALPRPDET